MSLGLQYHVDIVFCIDCTGSMEPVIDLVKEKVRKFPIDLKDALAKKGQPVHELRVRVIAFRDFASDTDCLEASEFFTVAPPTDLTDFTLFVNQLSTNGGGGDEPESGLEALAIAMGSDWTDHGDKQRHLIVMFTDASAHKLEDRVGAVPAAFSGYIPDSLDVLTDMWDGGVGVKLKTDAHQLIIFGPDAYPWNMISDGWNGVVFVPVNRNNDSGTDFSDPVR
jgi:hypothetical protein